MTGMHVPPSIVATPVEKLSPLSLRANFSWTFVGNVVYAGSQWGMLVVLAKLGTPEMVGQFSLGLAVTAPVIMFANLQLRAVQATDARREYHFSDYFGLRLLTTLLALVVIAGITLASGYRWETALVILGVGVAKAFESISDVFYGLFQQRERMDRIAKSMMIKGPLSLAALGIGVALTGTVLGGVVGLATVWAALLLAYDVRNGMLILRGAGGESEGRPCPRWDIPTLRRLAWLALPLGLVMMLISLNTNIPRYFVEQYWGERELGIFAAMAYLMVAGRTVVQALGQSASPRLATYYANGNHLAFRNLLLKLVGIGAMLGVGGVFVAVLAGRELLTLLYQPEYAGHVDVFIWLMLAAGIIYTASFIGYGMTAVRYFRVQLPLFSLAVSSTMLTCMLLIPDCGLQGAATALIVTAVVQLAGGTAIIIHALYWHRPSGGVQDSWT